MSEVAPPSSTEVRSVEELNVDDLPRGCKLRLNVALAHDGFGAPLQVPLLVARGERPGPVFGITAAVHGNELNGIPVIHRLFERLDPARLRGTVVAVVVVNVLGYLNFRRQFVEGIDLNHVFPGRPDGSVWEVFVYRLVERIVRRFDYLVDLHTASFGRVNSLYVRADMTDPTAARMAYLQRPQIIVHNPASDRTLRGTAGELGIPAITLEIGNPQRFQPEFVRTALVGLRSVMAEAGMIPKRNVAPGVAPVLCSHSAWTYTDHGGLLRVFPQVAQRVHKGDVLARLRNVFGELVREYTVQEDAIVVGKSVNPVGQTGARVAHLGIVADPEDLGFLGGPTEETGRMRALPATGGGSAKAVARGEDEG